MTATIKTFQCGCGDSIFLIIDGEEGRYVVMIDCGVFTSEIKDFITGVLESHINMLIVTHIDADHILGVRDMLDELPELKIDELWFNSYQRPEGDELPLTEREKDVYGLIVHSDQGFQYTSNEYKAICASKGITISMSRKGTPIDDSPMESWHGILKKETLYNNNITSLEHYIQLVEEWIAFYNSTRLKNRNLHRRHCNC